MAETRSNTPLFVSLAGLVTCCFPVGLIGAGFALLDWKKARESGQGLGGRNVAAIVIGLASAGPFGWTISAYLADQAAKEEQLASALAGVSDADRAAETLSQATACALAEAFLVEESVSPHPVTCAGPLEPSPGFATLRGVTMQDEKPNEVTICLARKDRWFVTAESRSGRCPTTLPEVKAGMTQNDTERAIRREATEQIAALDVEAFVQGLAPVRAALQATGGPQTCAALDAKGLPVLDGARLPDGATVPPPVVGWGFLSSEDLRDALDTGKSATDRARAAQKVKLGSHLIVVDAADRRLPKDKGETFSTGYLDGRLLVVDVKTGAVACETPFQFESSDEIEYGGGMNVGAKRGPKVNVGGTDFDDALEEDFRKRYAQAMSGALKTLTAGQVSAAW